MSKFSVRWRIALYALPRLLLSIFRRRPHQVRTILVAHHLLLGDSVMLSPLLHKLRLKYPAARITLLCRPPFVDLLCLNPWQIDVLPYQPDSVAQLQKVIAAGPYDLAYIPGENRYSWLALAAGSRWIIAHKTLCKRYYSLPVDEAIEYPQQMMVWSDAIAKLCDGNLPQATPWLVKECEHFSDNPYVVLHIGASNPTRFWPAERWFALAEWFAENNYTPIWSGAESERKWIDVVDPEKRYLNMAGKLSLSQLLALLKGATVLICADSGIAHIAKLVATPTITLYGPGNPQAFGPGEYWAKNVIINAGFYPITCRDQHVLFSRTLPWLTRCARSPKSCLHFNTGYSDCMRQITIENIMVIFKEIIGNNNDVK
ncbi:glycosyltransferase family 9 protein [Edwardsiella tarda]|uniref:glycosyltransferase family 9 protein n=1 Tax=Edwardsiella tarda TaxID=636 RepID=UPI00351C3C92